MTTILDTLAAHPWLIVLAAGCTALALYALAAVLTAKPEPEPAYVVEQLDDEWAVLMRVVGGER